MVGRRRDIGMTVEKLTPETLERHLRRMRFTAGAFLATIPAAMAFSFLMPHRGTATVSPTTITLVAVAASLWVGFTANRDGGNRLERIKRAGAAHGDDARLLRDHWLVYVVILLRLEMLVVGGVVVALWGLGPAIGVWLMLLGGLMIVLTWPTARKTQLLLGRVRALRGDQSGAGSLPG